MQKKNCMEVAATPAFTTAPVVAERTADVLPEFGRWRDVQRLFGIRRGTLYSLVADGKVKSVSMRRKGNKHGCRLFYLPGISAYLRSLLAAQNSGPNPLAETEKS
jgi:hypothetical protein